MRMLTLLFTALACAMWTPRLEADPPLDPSLFRSSPDPYPGVTVAQLEEIVEELENAAAHPPLGASARPRLSEPIDRRRDPFGHIFISRGGLYTHWRIEFDADVELERLRAAQPEVDDDRRLLLDWYRAANKELLRRTQAVYDAHGLGDAWESEQEFEVMFQHPLESPHVRVEKYGVSTLYRTDAARFLGERLVNLRDQPEPMDPPSPAPNPERRSITVELIPRKAQWAEHETIMGAIVVTNTSGKTVRVKDFDNFWNEHVRIAHVDGRGLDRWPVEPLLCGGTRIMGRYTAWGPGESHATYFSFQTNPNGVGPQWKAPPGAYRLEYLPHDWSEFVDVTVKNATIEVVPADHAP